MDYLGNCEYAMNKINNMHEGLIPWNEKEFNIACANVNIFSILYSMQEKEGNHGL